MHRHASSIPLASGKQEKKNEERETEEMTQVTRTELDGTEKEGHSAIATKKSKSSSLLDQCSRHPPLTHRPWPCPLRFKRENLLSVICYLYVLTFHRISEIHTRSEQATAAAAGATADAEGGGTVGRGGNIVHSPLGLYNNPSLYIKSNQIKSCIVYPYGIECRASSSYRRTSGFS